MPGPEEGVSGLVHPAGRSAEYQHRKSVVSIGVYLWLKLACNRYQAESSITYSVSLGENAPVEKVPPGNEFPWDDAS